MGRWYLGQLANGSGLEDAAFLDLHIQEDAGGASIAAGLVVFQQPEMEVYQRLMEAAQVFYQGRDRLRLLVQFRKAFIDRLLAEGEEAANAIAGVARELRTVWRKSDGRIMDSRIIFEEWWVQMAMEYFHGKVTAMSVAPVFSFSESNDSAVHDSAPVQLLDPGDQRTLRRGKRATASCWNSSQSNRRHSVLRCSRGLQSGLVWNRRRTEVLD